MRLFVLFFLMLTTACQSVERVYESHEKPPNCVVQLRYVPLPELILDTISIHYYFVVYEPEPKLWRRWELWRRGPFYCSLKPNPEKQDDWGHIRCDMFDPDSEIGGGPAVIAAQWTGKEAIALRRVLERPERFPLRHRYWGYPGPNSNTYAAWVLKQAGVGADLDPRAIGKDDPGIIALESTPTNTGLQLETPMLGVKLGLLDGFEFQVIALVFGVDFAPPALKTPIGRIGFSEDLKTLPSVLKGRHEISPKLWRRRWWRLWHMSYDQK